MSLLFINTETNGSNSKHPKIIEFVYIKTNENNEILDSGSFLIKHDDYEHNPYAESFNKITAEMIKETGITNESFISKLDELMEDVEYLVAHSIPFVYSTLKAAHPGLKKTKFICTLELSRRINLRSCKLNDVYNLLYDNYKELEHRVIKKVEKCRDIYRILSKRNQLEYIYNPKPIYNPKENITVMPMGKYKGMLLKDIPDSYIKWLQTQSSGKFYSLLPLILREKEKDTLDCNELRKKDIVSI